MTLLKCVWCHGEGRLLSDESGDRKTYGIKCQKCGFSLSGFDKKSEAMQEWNRMLLTADSRLFAKGVKA